MRVDDIGVYGVQELTRCIAIVVFAVMLIAVGVVVGGFALMLLASLISCLLFPGAEI